MNTQSTKFNSNNNMDIRCGELMVVRINKNYWTQCWYDSYADRDGDETKVICDINYNGDMEEKLWDIINDRVVFLYEKNITRDERHFEILYVVDEELEKAEQHGHLEFIYDELDDTTDNSDSDTDSD